MVSRIRSKLKNVNMPPLPGGVRPYESLWSLLHRYMWLTGLSASEFKNNFDILLIGPGSGFELMCGARKGVHNNILTRFTGLKGLTPNIHSVAYSRSILPESFGHAKFKYCPICANVGYHSIIFCYPGVVLCPIHNCTLLSECGICGSLIKSLLDECANTYPYSCPHCKVSLVSDPKSFFVDRPVKDVRRLSRLYGFYQKILNSNVAWGVLESPEVSGCGRYELDSLVLAAKSLASGLPIPKALDLPIDRLFLMRSYCFDMNAEDAFLEKSEEVFYASIGAAYRPFLKLKSKRRSLTKILKIINKNSLSRNKWIFKAYVHDINALYTEIFFRAHFEQWSHSKLFERTQLGNISYTKSSPTYVRGFASVYAYQRGAYFYDDYPRSDLSALSPKVASWIYLHVSEVIFSATHKEIGEYVARMIEMERILDMPFIFGVYMPFCFTACIDKSMRVLRLDFWGVRGLQPRPSLASMQVDYRIQQEKIMMKRAQEITNKIFPPLGPDQDI